MYESGKNGIMSVSFWICSIEKFSAILVEKIPPSFHPSTVAISAQPLTEVEIFHTDRGKEFDNQAIDELLTTFDINRSLSHKGCPFDNAVAESTYKSLKVEFVYQYTFETLQQLDLELFDYVNWWNHLRLHGTLGYETPVGYRNQRLAQRILDNELGCANASEAV
ncbi:hypothetical protein EfmJHP38_03050 [Enterococcus faecium]|nr:hypothetical protein EfmJHP38_03050 [Enterococcus faecium]